VKVRRLFLRDYAFVRDCMLHADVFPFIHDDGTGDENAFARMLLSVVDNDAFIFLSPGPGCVFMLSPTFSGVYTVHTAVKPEYRGRTAIEYGKAAIGKFFEKQDHIKLISFVPGCNRRAKIFALKCGFRTEGTLRKSWKQGGIVYNVDIVGLTRQEWELCQQQQCPSRLGLVV